MKFYTEYIQHVYVCLIHIIHTAHTHTHTHIIKHMRRQWVVIKGMVSGVSLLLLLSRFSRVRFCATPWTAAHLAPFIFKSSLYIGWHRSRAWHTPAGINESSGEMWAEGKGGSNKLRCLQLTILSKVSSNHRGAVRWRLQRIEKPWTTWQTPQSSGWFPFTFYKH